jgi:hypothetical protein
MARYFFHVSLQDRVILDREGWELPSMDAAKARALEVARRLLASGAVRGSEQAAFHIVGTLRGVPFTVPFEEAKRQATRPPMQGNAPKPAAIPQTTPC